MCVAALGITSAEPRDWTEEEIAIVEETAERTWAYVERIRAEGELRASEQRFRTVADDELGDASAGDPRVPELARDLAAALPPELAAQVDPNSSIDTQPLGAAILQDLSPAQAEVARSAQRLLTAGS